MPYIAMPNGERYVSILWSVIFGTGFSLSYLIFGYSLQHPFPTLFFGQVVWPALVSVLLFVIAGLLWAHTASRGKAIALLLLALSLGPIVSLSRASKPPFSNWPTYQNVMGALW